MAAKIKVAVDVDDGAFSAFSKKFADYKKHLDQTPEAWKTVTRSSDETRAHFEMVAAAIGQQADDMARLAGNMDGFKRGSESTSRHWHNLAQSTQKVAGHIKAATASLMKWGALTGVIGGITGGAGFLGIDTIGYGVAARRSESMGLGATYGGRSSFVTNFARLGDAGGLLSRVNEIEHRADNVPLTALGLSGDQVRGDTGDVAANAILKLKELVDSVKDPRFLSDRLHANRADELISLEQAQILRKMSSGEVHGMVSAYRRDKSHLGLGSDAQRKWQEFATQMARAGTKIENTFVDRLSAIAPGLTSLSKSVTHLAEKLTEENGPLSHWLDSLGHGVEWLAGKIDKPEFQIRVEKFVDGVGSLAIGVGRLLKGVLDWALKLGFISSAQAHEYAGRGAGAIGGAGGAGASGSASASHAAMGSGSPGAIGGKGIDPEVVAYIRQAAIARGMDPDVAVRVAMSEGLRGFSPSKGTWSSGSNDRGTSFGPLQAHIHSNIPGFTARGQGDAMLEQGIDPRDIHQWKKVINWQLDYAKRHGWSEWHGWRGPPRAGLNHHPANTTTKITINRSSGSDPNLSAAAAAAH